MSASYYLSHQQLRLRWEEPFCHLVAVARNCTSHTQRRKNGNPVHAQEKLNYHGWEKTLSITNQVR